jgi:hypothetical protein
MKLHVIWLIAAAVSIDGPMTEARSRTVRDGTPERPILIGPSKRGFHETALQIIRHRYPDFQGTYELYANPPNSGCTYEVIIDFSTASHGRHKMYFRTTSRDLGT